MGELWVMTDIQVGIWYCIMYLLEYQGKLFLFLYLTLVI